MRNTFVIFVVLATLGSTERAGAQNVAPTPAPPARAVAGTAAGAAPRNIRFDISIVDSGTGLPTTKVVTLNVAQGGMGSIRSTAPTPGMPVSLPRTVTTRGADGKESTTTQATTPTISLNVDVNMPTVFEDGAIRALVVIEYQPYVPAPATASPRPQPAVVRANSMSVFENGKKMVLLQAADPLSDRRTTIEVTATILR
jgi:hypothetical protein